jgi:hypothetical protein
VTATQDIYYYCVDKSVHTYDMSMELFFEMFQMMMIKGNRFESFLEKFGINDVTMVRRFFFLFQKVEYILTIFSKKYQNYRDDNPDNYRKKNNKCSHIS